MTDPPSAPPRGASPDPSLSEQDGVRVTRRPGPRAWPDLQRLVDAEERWLVSEERFHQLVHAVVDYAIFMLDDHGRIASWNPGAAQIKGYEEGEIIGQHFSVFYTKEDRAAGKPERILDTVRRCGRVEDESWRVRKDGSRFWGNVVVTALNDRAGKLIGFAKVTRDLTQRRLVEEALRRSEERFRLLVESVTDYAIYMLTPEGQVATWNDGAERMKGYPANEIVGRHFSVFFPEEAVHAGKPALELAAARRDGRYEDEGWRVRRDGNRFWANAVLTALRDEQGQLLGFAKITRDLTQRREAEQTQRRLLQEQAARTVAEELARRAEHANQIKDEFLATVSHELRTPLNAILGWASLLRQRPLEASLNKAIDVIHRNALAQLQIVEDILDVSQIITGKLRVEPRPTDLDAVSRAALDVVRHSAQAKQIELEYEAPSDSRPIVADPERLQQAVWNLLSNAVKFTDPGGSIKLRLARDDSEALVEVSDTGRGIAPEFQPFVFERFKQVDASTTRRHGGLGLGLALVRHIVELHGGTVSVRSDGVGAGSVFTLRLPQCGNAPTSEPAPSSPLRLHPHASGQQVIQGLVVLVVDDELDACQLVEAVLSDAGASVQLAGSASEGFEALRRLRPDVVVSDIGMADEDGYSFMRRVRALEAGKGGATPSIALTAYQRAEDRTRALAAGFTTHIGKPVRPEDLVAAVANLGAFSRRRQRGS